jgi:hypothetical protein
MEGTMGLPVRVVIYTIALAMCFCACAKKEVPIVEPEPYGLYLDKREINYDHPRKAFFINEVIEEDAR